MDCVEDAPGCDRMSTVDFVSVESPVHSFDQFLDRTDFGSYPREFNLEETYPDWKSKFGCFSSIDSFISR